MSELVSDNLADEIKQILTEGEFSSRWTLIETYHKVGEVICGVNANRTELLQGLAQKVGRSMRTLWYAAKFYETYPDLGKLPEGKNVSMNKIVTKYLTAPNGENCTHEKKKIISFEKCEDCGKHLGKVKNEA